MEKIIIRILFLLFYFTFYFPVISQENFRFKKVKIKDGKLKLFYFNYTNSNIVVPILKFRIDPDTRLLNKGIYKIINDTLIISLSKKDFNSLKLPNGESPMFSYIEYTDKILGPGKSYKTSVDVESSNDSVNLIKIEYDNGKSISRFTNY